MGAWIEIIFLTVLSVSHHVAPHDGCVDWNRFPNVVKILPQLVAPPRWVRGLKFPIYSIYKPSPASRTPRWVRGLKFQHYLLSAALLTSHPTMGAWIEICQYEWLWHLILVAPHDGCVDWNICMNFGRSSANSSHPTMGAWIEIPPTIKLKR